MIEDQDAFISYGRADRKTLVFKLYDYDRLEIELADCSNCRI